MLMDSSGVISDRCWESYIALTRKKVHRRERIGSIICIKDYTKSAGNWNSGYRLFPENGTREAGHGLAGENRAQVGFIYNKTPMPSPIGSEVSVARRRNRNEKPLLIKYFTFSIIILSVNGGTFQYPRVLYKSVSSLYKSCVNQILLIYKLNVVWDDFKPQLYSDVQFLHKTISHIKAN
jgi:hypothetical protein